MQGAGGDGAAVGAKAERPWRALREIAYRAPHFFSRFSSRHGGAGRRPRLALKASHRPARAGPAALALSPLDAARADHRVGKATPRLAEATVPSCPEWRGGRQIELVNANKSKRFGSLLRSMAIASASSASSALQSIVIFYVPTKPLHAMSDAGADLVRIMLLLRKMLHIDCPYR